MLVFFFTLAVLEKAEVSLLPFIVSDTELTKELIQKDAENTSSKETENGKESSTKEYWACCSVYQLSTPYRDHQSDLLVLNEPQYLLRFYPSVPTPPPNQERLLRLSLAA